MGEKPIFAENCQSKRKWIYGASGRRVHQGAPVTCDLPSRKAPGSPGLNFDEEMNGETDSPVREVVMEIPHQGEEQPSTPRKSGSMKYFRKRRINKKQRSCTRAQERMRDTPQQNKEHDTMIELVKEFMDRSCESTCSDEAPISTQEWLSKRTPSILWYNRDRRRWVCYTQPSSAQWPSTRYTCRTLSF